jgi:hypothetical protein
MKDVGATNFILGIEIKINWENKKLWLNRKKYIESLLWRFNMQDCKLVKVPIHVGVNLSTDQCLETQEEEEDMSHVVYTSVVCSLMYEMVCTRSNNAHAVEILSRYMLKLEKEN